MGGAHLAHHVRRGTGTVFAEAQAARCCAWQNTAPRLSQQPRSVEDLVPIGSQVTSSYPCRLHPPVARLAPPAARRYMLWGLIGSQLGNCEVNMTGYGPDPVPVNLFLAEVFDIKLDFIWVSACGLNNGS